MNDKLIELAIICNTRRLKIISFKECSSWDNNHKIIATAIDNNDFAHTLIYKDGAWK